MKKININECLNELNIVESSEETQLLKFKSIVFSK